MFWREGLERGKITGKMEFLATYLYVHGLLGGQKKIGQAERIFQANLSFSIRIVDFYQ